MAQEDSRQEGRRAERWARVNFPNKFVHPHEYTARDGRVFDKMFVSIPPGVTLNGVDLGGYAFDHFAKPREIEQKANGRPVAINFRPGEPVRLFRGVGPERRTLEISNPWDLCRDGGGIRTGPMSGKGEWVNLRFPNAFAHPFSFQGRDGGTRERMLVTIPKGVVLEDGRDVGGWNLSVRATPWALAQKRAGRPVSIGLRVGRTVELFKGRGPRRVTLRLDGPEGLRSALDEHRNVMSARVAVPADPGRGCRGSLDDAAPPMDGPAGDEGMLLFNDLAFDSGFVARMDTLASRFADDFAHGRYDAGTALRETRSLVAEAAMLMETVTGASYGAGAADCAASLALSAVTDAVNGYVDDLVDRNDCDPRVAAANHAERSADPHARPGTLPCLRMFTTAYGKTDETDVFGDGAPVEGMESSSMQLTR